MAGDNRNQEEQDIFVLNSVFPEAEPLFAFKLKTLNSIKDDCHVVLDTNVLLIPYTTSPESMAQIRTTYTKLVGEKRLIIPGQVAREFAKNRAQKISDIYQQLAANRDSIQLRKSSYPLLEPLEVFRQHVELERKIDQLLSEYRKSVTSVLQLISNWTWNDPVSELYTDLFSANVVRDPPFDQAKLTVEFESRKKHRIPPGYKDRGAGDLVIWKTILEDGRTNDKDVIFVSNDVKSDWWYQSNKEALYPRYELVDEFRRETKGRSLHIVTFSTFLALYGADDTTVEEVRLEEELARIRLISTRRHTNPIKGAVLKWLLTNYPDSSTSKSDKGFHDFVVSSPDDNKLAVVVRAPRESWFAIRQLKDIEDRIKTDPDASFNSYIILFVGRNAGSGMLLHARLKDLKHAVPNLSIFAGFINEKGDFEILQ